MATDAEVKKLEMTIVELQNQLKELRAARKAVDINPEEVKAYLKVRDVLQVDFGDFCGINDCMRCVISVCRICTVCRICRICRICDVECICGPCAGGGFGGYYGGGMSRFTELGE